MKKQTEASWITNAFRSKSDSVYAVKTPYTYRLFISLESAEMAFDSFADWQQKNITVEKIDWELLKKLSEKSKFSTFEAFLDDIDRRFHGLTRGWKIEL